MSATEPPAAATPDAAGAAPAPPPSERPIIAFFDVDNTLMRGTSIFEVGREAVTSGLIRRRDILLFAWHQLRFIRVGENDAHLRSARERALGLVEGRTEDQVLQLAGSLWEKRIRRRLYPDSVELAREHLRKGHEVWLVSATPVEIGRLMAHNLGLTGALGTIVEAVDGVYTGRLVGHVLHAERKAAAARALVAKVGADPRDCWAYSDSRNDIPLLEYVGNRVVVNPDAMLARHAHKHGWPVMRLTAKSIREQRRRVRREARAVRRSARRGTKRKRPA